MTRSSTPTRWRCCARSARSAAELDGPLRTVRAGARWAAESAAFARLVAPYYPAPAEFARAVRRAQRCGAAGLDEALTVLSSLSSAAGDPLCSDASGRIHWYSEALAAARCLT